MAIVVDAVDVASVRAEDLTGGFGILPGHANLLTVLPASVVRWRAGDGRERYCAIRRGVLGVSDGSTVSIACREAITGDDLAKLEGIVHAAHVAESDADRRARVEQTRLHARAVRQLMRYLRPEHQSGTAVVPGKGFTG